MHTFTLPFYFPSYWISSLSGIGLHTSLTTDVRPASTWGSARVPLWPSWRSKSHNRAMFPSPNTFCWNVCSHLPCFFYFLISYISLTTSFLLSHHITSHHSLHFCLCAGFLEREYSGVCTVCVWLIVVCYSEVLILKYFVCVHAYALDVYCAQ